MKRLPYLVVVIVTYQLSAQSFPMKNVNDEYIVTSLKGSEKFKNHIKEVLMDKNGLYWFQNLTSISSFDGVNWKSYSFTNADGRNIPIRINEIEVTSDSTIWLATAEGVYVFNPKSGEFVPVKQMIPQISGLPAITNCIYKGINDFLLVSNIEEGFYLFDWNKKKLKRIVIDSVSHIHVPIDQTNLYVTTDTLGNYWGITEENKGVWFYNISTEEVKRSWKGEILPKTSHRLLGKHIKSITYSQNDNALLLSYGSAGILEKIFLSSEKSVFYTFSDALTVRADTNSNRRHSILHVKTDPAGNEWLLVASKYLVKLNSDIAKFEYLEHDPDLLSLGKIDWMLQGTNMKNVNKTNDDNLFWVTGDKGLSILKKKNSLVKQVHFEEESIGGITPKDYINRDLTKEDIPFQNMFFVNNFDGSYLLLQQNAGRPKLLRFDKDLHITNTLFNNKWREYPAYFNPSLRPNEFYIAILRPGDEPLDFRHVVIKDFKVDLKTMKSEEVKLSFSERVWRYGAADEANVFWLFSNGYLYSFSPKNDLLDSIFICQINSKRKYNTSRIKGYDFPTVLHKNSSTFWISFISDKELYKINLKKRIVEKIFKSAVDKKGYLSSSVYQLYGFDSSRIYMKYNFSAALLNPFNDSVTTYSDLFLNKLPFEDHVGAVSYKDWLCSVTTFEINLQNKVTGKQKKLSLDKDFKWPLSAFSFPPLINNNGEMVLMSSAQRGFVILNIDSILAPSKPGNVHFSFIKLNEKDLPLDSLVKNGSLRLNYNGYSSIHFKFSDYSILEQGKIKYEYTLYNGGDTVWNNIEGDPELTFTKITPGNYKLLIRATNSFGDYSSMVTAFSISIIPPFTQTVWFIFLIVAVIAAILYGLYRYRLQQINKLQIVRNNIASDLHDDIGSTLNSISIYSEVAKQQAGKEIPALDMIGVNSRKIIESMSDIVWTINPENDSFEKIIVRMRSFAYQLLKAKKVEYTFEVDEKLNSIALPMQVRKNFYLVFKEAITNVVKYSEASRVSIDLFEKNRIIMLRIRDNGKGIPVNAQTLGNGLMNMTRRAKEISAELNIISANGGGTEIELMLKT